MNDAELLKTIAVIASPILLTMIGWFLREMVKKHADSVEKAHDYIQKLTISNALLEREIVNLTDDLKTLISEFKNFRTTQEDVVILKRDQQTIWKRIDEMKSGFKN